MNREELLRENVEDKFIRYAKMDTGSDDEVEQIPSSEGQWKLLRLLQEELLTLGLTAVELTSDGILLAEIPGRTEAPRIGLLAHVDTAPGVPSRNIRPVRHENYQGGDIPLSGGVLLSPADCPSLAKAIGHEIITSDGSTLLGADDKAGVAAIMAAVCRWMSEPDRARPVIRLAFTPDEETGRGIHRLEPEKFGVYCAYTVDGGVGGELEAENFNGANFDVIFQGAGIHPGSARSKMINALHLAAEFIQNIPAGQRPETTDEGLGFIHAHGIKGNVEEAVLQVIIRDFEADLLAERIRWMKLAGRLLETAYPGAKVRFKKTGGYANMRQAMDRDPRIVAMAVQAYQNTGVKPEIRRIRGGTDGAVLSERGIPTPNLFTGGVNFHSRTEWLSVTWLRQSVEVLLELGTLWAGETK